MKNFLAFELGILLLLVSSAINYIAALLIEKFRGKTLDSVITFLAVAFNLLALLQFGQLSLVLFIIGKHI